MLVAALLVYAVARAHDLAHRGALGLAFAPSTEALLFRVEFLGGVLLPMVLLALPAVRANVRWLYGSALLVVMGFVTNRLNVAITGFEAAQGERLRAGLVGAGGHAHAGGDRLRGLRPGGAPPGRISRRRRPRPASAACAPRPEA